MVSAFVLINVIKMFIITLSDFMNVIVYVMTFYWKIEKLLYDQEFNPK